MKSVFSAKVSRTVLDATRWAVPGAILILLPKCPVCFAAYIAIGTGVGVSASTAANIQSAMVMVCLGILVALTVQNGCRLIRQSTRINKPQKHTSSQSPIR